MKDKNFKDSYLDLFDLINEYKKIIRIANKRILFNKTEGMQSIIDIAEECILNLENIEIEERGKIIKDLGRTKQ